ncbi:MAG: hypothetical protein ABIY55_26480, partial [Kofleriaceae bacterium]
ARHAACKPTLPMSCARALLIGAMLVAAVEARAGVAPVRVHVVCESEGRTKACPVFILGFIDARKILLASPRADADVVLHVNASAVAVLDRLHLRFVGTLAGAPQIIESDVDIDCRAADDAQRRQLEPAFLRGIALFVAARDPTWVTVAIEPSPAAADGAVAAVTQPYDAVLELTGLGTWTHNYQMYNGTAALTLSRTSRQLRVTGGLSANGGVNRQPPLMLDDGRTVSLDTSPWQIGASATVARLATSAWSYGAVSRVLRDDPKGQYSYQWVNKLAIEWDRFAADDPRGNRLAVLYAAGWAAESYRLRNVLGEQSAQLPVHALIANGSVRRDAVTVGLQLQLGAELLHPTRRHTISAAPYVEWQLGGHVDLHLAYSIIKREMPAEDPGQINPEDYAQLSRLMYAEPLAMTATINVSIHLDRTNGERNDRLSDL